MSRRRRLSTVPKTAGAPSSRQDSTRIEPSRRVGGLPRRPPAVGSDGLEIPQGYRTSRLTAVRPADRRRDRSRPLLGATTASRLCALLFIRWTRVPAASHRADAATLRSEFEQTPPADSLLPLASPRGCSAPGASAAAGRRGSCLVAPALGAPVDVELSGPPCGCSRAGFALNGSRAALLRQSPGHPDHRNRPRSLGKLRCDHHPGQRVGEQPTARGIGCPLSSLKTENSRLADDKLPLGGFPPLSRRAIPAGSYCPVRADC
jgi:hypothetical protein